MNNYLLGIFATMIIAIIITIIVISINKSNKKKKKVKLIVYMSYKGDYCKAKGYRCRLGALRYELLQRPLKKLKKWEKHTDKFEMNEINCDENKDKCPHFRYYPRLSFFVDGKKVKYDNNKYTYRKMRQFIFRQINS